MGKIRKRKGVYNSKSSILKKVFITIFGPHGMWDLSSLTRDQTYIPRNGSAES